MLSPISWTQQPFRFVALAYEDQCRLQAVTRCSSKLEMSIPEQTSRILDTEQWIVDTEHQLSTEIHIGKCLNWITFSPDGRYGAVSNSGSDDSSIIDTRTRREVARVRVGKAPKRLLAVTVP